MILSDWLTLPIFLIGSLLTAAALTYLTRVWERTTALIGLAVTGFWFTLLWQVDLSQPLWLLPAGQVVDLGASIERLGFTFRLEPGAIPILTALFFLTATAYALAATMSQGRSFVPISLVLVAGYAAVALLSTAPLAPPLLIPLLLAILAALSLFVLQAGRLTSPAGPLRNLIPPVLGFVLFLLASWYIEQIPLNPQDTAAARHGRATHHFRVALDPVPCPAAWGPDRHRRVGSAGSHRALNPVKPTGGAASTLPDAGDL